MAGKRMLDVDRVTFSKLVAPGEFAGKFAAAGEVWLADTQQIRMTYDAENSLVHVLNEGDKGSKRCMIPAVMFQEITLVQKTRKQAEESEKKAEPAPSPGGLPPME